MHPPVTVADDAVQETAARDEPVGRLRRWWRRYRRIVTHPVVSPVLTTLAALLVLFALVLPNEPLLMSSRAFLRIPVEALVGIALVLVLPRRAQTVVAIVAGVVLGLLTVMKVVDLGFYDVLGRPFDPVPDWPLLGDAADFIRRSMGRKGEYPAVTAALGFAVLLPALMALAMLRLRRALVGHRTAAARGVAVAGVVWVACAALGAQLVPGLPVASTSASVLAYYHTAQVTHDLRDARAFAAAERVDAYRDAPGDQLLTGLRGKDVLFTFVESYGRVALADPQFAPQMSALLDAGYSKLRAAGYVAQTGWLNSPTRGGGSWLAHSSLMSGLWVNNQQRYNTLLAGDRFTLNKAFKRAGWHTADIESAVNVKWPQGAFYQYDDMYIAPQLKYKGPPFNFGSMPDQYTLAQFQRLERAPGHAPLMAQIVLLSSHAPWAPLPQLIDWNSVGDGSSYAKMRTPYDTPDVGYLHDPKRLRVAYIQAVEYSVSTLLSYVQTYGDKNLVMVFLGDHQPAPIVTGRNAPTEVPVTILAQDPDVLRRISSWGWQDGLKPKPDGPVWGMDAFRDRFLAAFGPQGGAGTDAGTTTASPAPSPR